MGECSTSPPIGALIELEASAHVILTVTEGAIAVRASFGELGIPYNSIRKVRTDAGGVIHLDLGEAQIKLAVWTVEERRALMRALRRRVENFIEDGSDVPTEFPPFIE